jgi:hypothetical protein
MQPACPILDGRLLAAGRPSQPGRVLIGRKHGRHGRQVISGDELDLETDRLRFLFGLDEDMTTRRTALRLFGMEGYSQGLQFAAALG